MPLRKERAARYLVSRSGGFQRIQLLLHRFFQLPQLEQVGHWLALFLHAVVDFLTVQTDFEPAICTRGQGDCYIITKGTEELVRHPRGGREMSSTDTVQDVYQRFPLRSHRYPPSYVLSSHALLSVNVA